MTSDLLAEHTKGENLVKKLIRSQFPDLADLPLRYLDAGWDNVSYRLGDAYLLRLPRRKEAEALVVHEIIWLPCLLNRLPIPIPAPVFVGQPDQTYPCQWTIVPWFEGVSASIQLPQPWETKRLIDFLKQLHVPAPESAPLNPYRGVPLAVKAEDVQARMDRLRNHPGLMMDTIRGLWDQSVGEACPEGKHLIHGDLHLRNIIVHHRKIAAIIDWGDITAGDVATDLACMWMLLEEPKVRREVLVAYGASESTIRRARGWAIHFGMAFLASGRTSQDTRLGEQILKNVQQDAG